MKIDEHELLTLVQSLYAYEDIQLIDIPDIDLYMDQVTTFMEKKLSATKRNRKDKILTKTMINNYTKDGILLPPKNKKYSRQHIILLILIYNLKQILSIKDIDILLAPLLKASSETDCDPQLWDKIYLAYLDLKQDDFDLSGDRQGEQLKKIREKTGDFGKLQQDIELLLIVLLLVNQAIVRKRLTEKIIDEYFDL
ncbi:Protein of unknown function DUF1836 [Syntrophomonas zehnderi OL-4]|uniref:DUF1836 domain-containing protein n=1 Tax=Syntrophomonas zehnderi OL-4 TaxID=690567 RepID=A0A0E4GF23_9FIRM|nr:DUF1836 domain-containing protein [Syntrophomonas zehnderi]CFY01800.1 Protein of unknown function DUF1836 [Syntrophomonas zehnderi OL-4]